jgi:hypothetical protein
MKQYDLHNAGYLPRDDIVGLDLTGVDMAFVDGKRAGRAPSIQYCIEKKIKVIVFHDSHISRHYGYDQLVIPDEYNRADFVYTGESRRATTVLWLGDEDVKTWQIPQHVFSDPFYFPTIGWGV